uniref:Uncharacterized protein n=1 Tax=Aureoumbra lagunensis TaxID=44058 RepID=A0A6S8EU45_9STRA|mmetsp:Transcript_19505/g.25265  ORF Transcript_19505/g.25265 Transcript_19505/m.25265 type:complete len:539 (-) Transcript_19505:100-1716(-)
MHERKVKSMKESWNVHHGSNVLRKTLQSVAYLQAETKWRMNGRKKIHSERNKSSGSCMKDEEIYKPKRNIPMNKMNQPLTELKSSSLLIEILEYLTAIELVNMRQAGGTDFICHQGYGYGPCELAASLSIRRLFGNKILPNHISTHPKHIIYELHIELTSCILTILRRREPILRELTAARGVAQIARETHRQGWAFHESMTTGNLSQLDIHQDHSNHQNTFPLAAVSDNQHINIQEIPQLNRRLTENEPISGVVVAGGIFADARLFDAGKSELTIELTPKETKALKLAARCLDGDIGGLGECVVASLNTSHCPTLESSPLQANGCWVLRRIDGRPCWSPRAFDLHVHNAQISNKKLKIEFDQAYDRRDLKIPLAAPAAVAVHLAKGAFGLDTREDVVLLAAGDEEYGRAVSPSGCWTPGDCQPLKNLGLTPGIKRTLILVVLPDYSTPPVLPSYVPARLPQHHIIVHHHHHLNNIISPKMLNHAGLPLNCNTVVDNSDAISDLSSSSSISSSDSDDSSSYDDDDCDSQCDEDLLSRIV